MKTVREFLLIVLNDTKSDNIKREIKKYGTQQWLIGNGGLKLNL